MSNCELWTGSVRGKGYGQVWDPVRKKQIGAHVKAWEDANGQQVPAGVVVMHSCDVKLCVNPEHLSVGTYSENMIDAITKGISKPPPPHTIRDPKTGRYTRSQS